MNLDSTPDIAYCDSSCICQLCTPQNTYL